MNESIHPPINHPDLPTHPPIHHQITLARIRSVHRVSSCWGPTSSMLCSTMPASLKRSLPSRVRAPSMSTFFWYASTPVLVFILEGGGNGVSRGCGQDRGGVLHVLGCGDGISQSVSRAWWEQLIARQADSSNRSIDASARLHACTPTARHTTRHDTTQTCDAQYYRPTDRPWRLVSGSTNWTVGE